jgi:hypothetical protein
MAQLGDRNSRVPWRRVPVVIPALNEARGFPHVLARLRASRHGAIVIDGHSADDTVGVGQPQNWPGL